MIAKLFALILIALAVSPLTAPFATCDVAAVNTSHLISDSMSATKVVQDVPAVPSLASCVVHLLGGEPFKLTSPVLSYVTGESRPLVLRL
jgi:hypothetical protein